MPDDQPVDITISMMRETLFTAVVSDALDSLGFRNQALVANIQPLTVEKLLVGRAKTTLWADMFHEDTNPYAMELQAVDSCATDDIFVAAAGGSLRSGVWGELLTTAASNGGCVGAIVDGAVRDLRQITELQFPVYAAGTSPYDSLHRQRVIDTDVTVEIGQTKIAPGDLIFADRDGVVVVPQNIENEAILQAWNKVHAENVTRDAIRAGMKATAAYEKYGVL